MSGFDSMGSHSWAVLATMINVKIKIENDSGVLFVLVNGSEHRAELVSYYKN